MRFRKTGASPGPWHMVKIWDISALKSARFLTRNMMLSLGPKISQMTKTWRVLNREKPWASY